MALVVSKFVCKNGRSIPCIKFGSRVVTFDAVIISAITGLSVFEIDNLENDYVICEIPRK